MRCSKLDTVKRSGSAAAKWSAVPATLLCFSISTLFLVLAPAGVAHASSGVVEMPAQLQPEAADAEASQSPSAAADPQPTESASGADKRATTEAPEEDLGFDASDIASRAVASALADSEGGVIDEYAAGAYDAVARDLLIRIEHIQKEKGNVARELEAPLLELGKLYVLANQCENAIPIIRQAILLTQRLDGVMNMRQLPMYEPLLNCLVTLDMMRDLEREQEKVLLVYEAAYGKNDVRMLPPLMHAGQWYETAGWYESARDVYLRASDIARGAGGDEDVRVVMPLRAVARTYRLQKQYEPEALRGRAMEAQGERMLTRAAKIVREHPQVDSQLTVDTLLALADWYQMSGAIRDANRTYKEVWDVAGSAGLSDEALLDYPEPILYRAAVGTALRRAPVDREKLQHYWIDFEFTVTRFGEVRDIVVADSTAPRHVQTGISENLKRTRYRPRFVDGEAVDTPGVRIRQGVWFQPN